MRTGFHQSHAHLTRGFAAATPPSTARRVMSRRSPEEKINKYNI